MHSLEQISFDYGALDEAQRVRVQVKAESIRARMKRTAEDIIAIGQDLIEVKAELEHGQFKSWLQSEFEMSYPTAIRFMQVGERFKNINLIHLPVSALYELAAPSTPDAIIEQVQAGAIPPNLDAIKEAKAAQKRAEDAEKQASEQARLAQQQLFAVQSEAQTKIDALTQQITSLQGEMQELTKPKVQVKEVRVVPPEIKEQLGKLQEKVRTLTEQRDNLSEQARKLGEENRQAFLRRNEVEQEQTARMHWRKTTQDFQECVGKLLAQMLTQTHNQTFESEDWDRLTQAKELARRFIAECDNLSRGTPEMVVDASFVYSEG